MHADRMLPYLDDVAGEGGEGGLHTQPLTQAAGEQKVRQ